MRALWVIGTAVGLLLAGCTSGRASTGDATSRPGHPVAHRTTGPSATAPRPGNAVSSGYAIQRHAVGRRSRRADHHPRGVYEVGDSLSVDARNELHAVLPGLHLNAHVGRQTWTGLGIVRAMLARGVVPRTLIFALGTNGPLVASQLRELERLTRAHHLVVVTAHCSYCSWTASSNATVRRLCTASRRCAVADFAAAAARNLDWFTPDGIHLPFGGRGARAFARIIATAVCGAPVC